MKKKGRKNCSLNKQILKKSKSGKTKGRATGIDDFL